MEETKWWSRLMLVSAVIGVVLLVSAPLGHKFGLVQLVPSFVGLLVGLLVGVIVALVAIVMSIIAHRRDMPHNRNITLIALGVGLMPVIIMLPQLTSGGSVPPIHDITTDTADPPTFNAVLPLRVDAPNGVEYGDANMDAASLAAAQQGAYPQVKSLRSSLSVSDALAHAETLLAEQGLEIVGRDASRVEATATTFWFGFKDDVVVRVLPDDSGSVVDVRSLSRVGGSDLGANAARISRFLESF